MEKGYLGQDVRSSRGRKLLDGDLLLTTSTEIEPFQPRLQLSPAGVSKRQRAVTNYKDFHNTGMKQGGR
jgi:hypothetical protein